MCIRDRKEVTVSIREGEHGMLISVDDSGAGIAADKLDLSLIHI